MTEFSINIKIVVRKIAFYLYNHTYITKKKTEIHTFIQSLSN